MSQEKGNRRTPRYDKRRVYRECTRKKGFATTKEANQNIKKAFRNDKVKLSYYKCHFCGKYHLTKKFVRSKF